MAKTSWGALAPMTKWIVLVFWVLAMGVLGSLALFPKALQVQKQARQRGGCQKLGQTKGEGQGFAGWQ